MSAEPVSGIWPEAVALLTGCCWVRARADLLLYGQRCAAGTPGFLCSGVTLFPCWALVFHPSSCCVDICRVGDEAVIFSAPGLQSPEPAPLGVFLFGWQHPNFFLSMFHIRALKKMKSGFICTREGLPFAKPRFAEVSNIVAVN